MVSFSGVVDTFFTLRKLEITIFFSVLLIAFLMAAGLLICSFCQVQSLPASPMLVGPQGDVQASSGRAEPLVCCCQSG